MILVLFVILETALRDQEILRLTEFVQCNEFSYQFIVVFWFKLLYDLLSTFDSLEKVFYLLSYGISTLKIAIEDVNLNLLKKDLIPRIFNYQLI